MAKEQLLAGTTSYIAQLFIQDSSKTDGSGLAGLTFGTGSLVASYARPGAARVAITLVTQTVTGAFSSGGFVEIDATNMPGCYRFDVPDAALAASAKSVLIMLKGAANMAPCLLEIELTAVNNQDAVRGGLSALPNAAAGANGGLPTGNASGQVTTVTNLDKTGYTASTVSDKTGYALSGAGVQAIWDALTSALTTVGSVGKRIADNLDAVLSSRLPTASYTTPPTAAAIQALVAAGPVASVTGAVGSVTAGVTITTNNDKAGYALSAGAVDAILDDPIGDGTITARQALRVLIAGMAAKLSGGATTTVTIRNLADTQDVIVATVDSDGNRSAVTVTP